MNAKDIKKLKNISTKVSHLISNNNTLIANSISNDGLYYSEDNGKTWKQSNITSGNFAYLVIIGSTVFASTDKYLNKETYYSKDNGKTWDISKSIL